MVFEYMSLSIVENIDCMTRLREAPDNHWDLAICDPPYGIEGRLTREDSLLNKYHSVNLPKGKYFNSMPCKEYFAELNRVACNAIIWGGNYFTMPPSRGFVIWDKLTGIPNISHCEYAWTSLDCCSKIFRWNNQGFLSETKIHPTQKPVALYKWLLTNYAKPGQTILDTHMGSQSSRIAAWDLGFDFTGFELDEDYYKAGCERFEIHTAQAKLFDAPVLETVEQNNLF